MKEHRYESEVFRGHLEECLRHLGASIAERFPKQAREAAQAKKPIANFCGVTIKSATLWLKDNSLPTGETLIKLMCYLDTIGYRIIELERIPKEQRNFAELIGFGILSAREAAELVGYDKPSRLYELFRRNVGIGKEKKQKIWDLWKEKKDVLELKKEQTQKLYWSETLLAAPKELQHQLALATKEAIPTKQQAPPHKATVVSIMEGLLSLLEESPGDTLADLQGFTEVVLRLSASLNLLSSRLIMAGQKKGG